MQRRGHLDFSSSTPDVPTSKLHAYVKPHSDEVLVGGSKKSSRTQKDVSVSHNQGNQVKNENNDSKNLHRGNQSSSRKKKSGKVVSLAEAAKGSIVFQQGKPCACQARQHKLVSNCLSCGKIVCEQEGEGPCHFCGALVLREGSTYAGLDESMFPLSVAEAAAEAYAKRLVEYDRDSAARTTVIDDQSDYYEMEGNSWLSMEEKECLRIKQEEIEKAEQARRKKVVVTFDLFGRKVLVNEDKISELDSDNNILRPPDAREVNRIKPNPTLRVQPVFIDFGPSRKPVQRKQPNRSVNNGLCLEITGRVQHENTELKHYMTENLQEVSSNENISPVPSVYEGSHLEDDGECSLPYR